MEKGLGKRFIKTLSILLSLVLICSIFGVSASAIVDIATGKITGIRVIGKAGNAGAEFTPDNLFDGDKRNTFWGFVSKTGWVVIDVGEPILVTRMKAYHNGQFYTNDPINSGNTKAYALQVYNGEGTPASADFSDNSKWVTVGEETNNTEGTKDTAIAMTSPSQYFRFLVTDNGDKLENKRIMICELELYDDNAVSEPDNPYEFRQFIGVKAINKSGEIHVAESAQKLFDGNCDEAKWCVPGNSGWVVFDMGREVVIDKIKTFHSEQALNPTEHQYKNTKSYEVQIFKNTNEPTPEECTNDNLWETIAKEDNNTSPIKETLVTSNKYGRYYRLKVNDSGDPFTNKAIRFYELQLFGVEKYNTVNVTLNKNGGAGEDFFAEYREGTEFIFPQCNLTPQENQRFDFWSVGDKKYQPNDKITLTESIEIKANFKDIPYVNISFNGDGGIGNMQDVIWDSDLEYTLPQNEFTKEGKIEFVGWRINNGFKIYKSGEKVILNGDSIVTAHWVSYEGEKITSDFIRLENGTYNVFGEVVNNNRLEISGRVTLVLAENSKLTLSNGIHVPSLNGRLTIEGNGSLDASSTNQEFAPIGGNKGESNGDITINGGSININSLGVSSCIGAGADSSGGFVVINDGKLTLNSNEGACIGGSKGYGAGAVYIYGGEITASTKSAPTIGTGLNGNGGFVTVEGGNHHLNSMNNPFIGGTDVRFTTGEKGGAVIEISGNFANASDGITDKTDVSKWNLILLKENSSSYDVFGNPTIKGAFEIKTGKNLILADNQEIKVLPNSEVIISGSALGTGAFKNEGTISNIGSIGADVKFSGNGKYFYKGAEISLDKILVPNGLVYTGLPVEIDKIGKIKQNNIDWIIPNCEVKLYKGDVLVNNILNAGEYKLGLAIKNGSVYYKPFTVAKAEAGMTFSSKQVIYGEAYTPSAQVTATAEQGKIKYEYEGIGKTEYPRSEMQPTEVGTYNITATYESENYFASVQDVFSIRLYPHFTVPQNTTALLNQSLMDITVFSDIPGEFQWENPDILLSEYGTKTYKAKFVPENKDVYAVIKDIEIPVTVEEIKVLSFNGNGGEGVMYDTPIGVGENFTLPLCKFTKNGYIFEGWSVNGKTYKVGESITIDKNTTAFAVWTVAIDNTGDGIISVEDYQSVVNKALCKPKANDNYLPQYKSDVVQDGAIDVLDIWAMENAVNKGESNFTVGKKGDFDINGVIDETDINNIKDVIVNNKQSQLKSYEKYACDLNSDGVVDNKDLPIINQLEIG